MYPNLFYYIFALILLLSIVFDLTKLGTRKHYIICYNLVFIFLACLVAFRYGVGNDTARYMLAFSITPELYKITLYDFTIMRAMPGYTFLVSFVRTFFGDFVYLQIFQSILFFGSLYAILKRLELRRFYLLLCFYGYTYFAEMSGMRECFGLSFCYFALNYFLDKKYIKYYILVTLGFLFHSGMIVFYFVPLVRLLDKYRKSNYYILLFAFAIMLYLLPNIRELVSGINDGSMSRYALSEGEGISLTNALVCGLYFFFIYKYCIKKNKQTNVMSFVYLGMVSVFFSLMGNLVPILYRYTSHFMIFFFYSIHLAFTNMKKGDVMAVLLSFLFFYTPVARFISGMNHSDRRAYCSVFSEDKSYYTNIINTSDLEDVFMTQ